MNAIHLANCPAKQATDHALNSLEIDGSVAKNGRYRNIPFEAGEFGEAQRLALDQAKKVCRKYDALGWPGLSFKQNENKYYYHLKRLGITKFESGVTGHGLRAEFSENLLLLRDLQASKRSRYRQYLHHGSDRNG